MTEHKSSWTPAWLIVGSAVVLFVLLAFTPRFYQLAVWLGMVSGDVVEKAGQFGETYGVLNSFLTSISLLFLAYTLWMQRQQLDIQSQELKSQLEQAKIDRRMDLILRLIDDTKRRVDVIGRTEVSDAEVGETAMGLQCSLLKSLEGVAMLNEEQQGLVREYAVRYWPIIRNVAMMIRFAHGVAELEEVVFASIPDRLSEAWRALMNCSCTFPERERIKHVFDTLPRGAWDNLSA